MRLIEIVRSVSDHLVTGLNLMGLMQGLPAEEMGYTPLQAGNKEAIRVDQATHRFGYEIVRSLQRYAADHLEFYGRCKRAAILCDWISGRKLDEIEADFSTNPYRGKIECGDIRRFADTTRFHLQSASNILTVLLLGKNPQAEIDEVLAQLEIGIPANALDLLRLPISMTRGEYLALINNGILKVAHLWGTSRELLERILGKDCAHDLERFVIGYF